MTKKLQYYTDERGRKCIVTKYNVDWQIAFAMLECMDTLRSLRNDGEFCRRYRSLFEYVSEKTALPQDGDIIEEYYAVAQSLPETSPQHKSAT